MGGILVHYQKWLQICVNPAAFFILLHLQVLDLLDYQGGPMKFETRHSPFPTSILTGCCVCDAWLTRRSPISSLEVTNLSATL